MADQRAQSAYRQFPVLWNGKVYAETGLAHYDVAADLPDDLPARFLECLDCFFARNVGKPGHSIKP